jgi:hypothetical protein
MTGCSFCRRNTSRMLVGLSDGRWVCGSCLPRLSVGPAIDPARIDDLVRLCHPDRHRGSMEKLATHTTQWLLEMRRQAREGA